MRATILIPTYNEAKNVPVIAKAIMALEIPELKILFIDDNSPDGTGEIAEGLRLEYPGRIDVMHRTEKNGLRSAYMAGIKQAIESGAEAVGQMDADLSHQPEKLPEMIEAIQNADFVLGSRYVPGGSVDPKWPRWRKALSTFGNTYARTILGVSELKDMTTGFRLWRVETLRGIPLERVSASGYIFLVEMAYLAHILGYRCAQVPIHFAERVAGASKMSLRIQIEAAYKVWQVRMNYRDLRKAGTKGRRHLT